MAPVLVTLYFERQMQSLPPAIFSDLSSSPDPIDLSTPMSTYVPPTEIRSHARGNKQVELCEIERMALVKNLQNFSTKKLKTVIEILRLAVDAAKTEIAIEIVQDNPQTLRMLYNLLIHQYVIPSHVTCD